MVLIIVAVFLGVFALAAGLILLSGSKDEAQNAQLAGQIQAGGSAGAKDQFLELRKSVLLSAVPWIDKWLLKFELGPFLRFLIYQANLKWTVGGLLMSCGVAFAGGGYLMYLRTESVLFAIIIGTLAGSAPLLYVLNRRRMRFNKFEEELPEALELMVSALRVGQSLNSSLGLVGRECPEPVGGEFRVCFEEQNFGLELRTAMENLITRIPLQSLRIVATAILIQKESGGNLAEVLEKTSNVIRDRFRLKRQIQVHTAQGRMTGWILTLLPVGLGFVLYFLDPVMMSVLWTRPIGVKLLWAGAGALTLGTLIIQKIVRMDV